MADEPIYLAQQTDLDNHKNATGNVHGMVKGDIGLGNVDNTADANKSVKHATTAGSLATARTITLTGDASGSVSFNGSKDVSIEVTVADDSHNHTIANVDGLQTALDGKETSGAAATALTNAKSYTDTKIANLINSAPTTLDTLGEIATAMEENADVVEALETAIGTKADAGHIHSDATTSASGFMSASDKTKLNGIAAGANKYSHPTYTAKSSGFYKVTVDGTGHVSGTAAVTKADITGLGIPAQDTVYTHPTTSGNKHIPSGGSSGQILRWSADGTAAWGDDSNTTYSAATQSAAGLMSADDKKKLDGIATGANKYTLPTAGSTLGGVKTTSTVTSTSGLTACPIIGGVPYYKDTNNTYSLSTFGITATAAELNYMDGVTSAVQTQINNLVNRVAKLEELLAYIVGIDDTGVYVTEGE